MLFKKKQTRPRRTKKKNYFSFWPRLPRLGFSVGYEARRGIWIITLILGAFAFGLSLCGQAGEIGFYLNALLTHIFGSGKWSMPALLGFAAISLAGNRNKNFAGALLMGAFLFLAGSSSLFSLYSFKAGGGVLGKTIVELILPYVGPWIAAALFSSGLIVSLLLLLDTSLGKLLGKESVIFKIIVLILKILFHPFIKKDFAKDNDEEEEEEEREEEEEAQDKNSKKAVVKEYEVEEERESGEEEALLGNEKTDNFSWLKSNIKMNIPLGLLKNKPKKPTSGNIDRNQEIIKRTLSDFGISINMGEVRVGPTVTQYTFKPEKGISVARVKALSDDLALNLALHPVRIEAPIPGRALVGLEVPNQTKVLVALKEILQSKKFNNRKSNMTVSLGRDVAGQIWLDDLAKMPHLLIAGATGSGKSVYLHSLITGLLYQNNPDDLKMILIDLKQVELAIYDGMPYLITPVVTDNKRAIRSLQWCLSEMDRRLEKLKDARCQNIQDYNRKRINRMPYLVIVVDELGDLLSTSRKEAEAAIIRLGQKARAAGIHLVLATQRPSVDILSGLIKANMPARIAFSVTSSVNSKTILDFTGAEKLLGQGDMLYINSSLSKPARIQGVYIGKDEIKAVVKYIKKKAGKADYIKEVAEKAQSQFSFEADSVDDELLEEAKRIIFEYNKASAAMLQSRLSIGYPRANRILDILEKRGIVGPSARNKPREVFKSN